MSGAFSRATCSLIDDRDEGRCQRCGKHLQGQAFSRHHRMGRGMGGTRNPRAAAASNGVLLCGTGTTGCHGEVESRKEEAEKLGFVVRRGDDPANRPVRTFRGWRYLTDDGRTMSLAEFAEVVGA